MCSVSALRGVHLLLTSLNQNPILPHLVLDHFEREDQRFDAKKDDNGEYDDKGGKTVAWPELMGAENQSQHFSERHTTIGTKANLAKSIH